MAYPELILLADHRGDPAAHIEAVYAAYVRELVRGRLTFLGKQISFKFEPATDGKGFAFWHAVSEGAPSGREEDRTIDLRRCERITWAAYMVAAAAADGQGPVLWWRTKRGGKTRVVLWLPDDAYAVVLEERQGKYVFWTTYTVKSGRARSFAKEHAEYWG